MYYPMMMFPSGGQNQNMPMPMPMPMPSTQSTQEGGDKNAQQQPMVYFMPVCVFDPSKMPKDMKIPNMPNMSNMQFPYFPYAMPYPQTTPDNK
jgi:hypothetical protein